MSPCVRLHGMLKQQRIKPVFIPQHPPQVPMMGLSLAVQRLLATERARAAEESREKDAEIALLKARLGEA